MRKWSLLLSILCLLTLSVRTTALPPLDFEIMYSAYVEVFDLNNNPVSGVNVCFRVDAWEGETGMPILRTTQGTTNANGYVALHCYINYYDYPHLTSMVAWAVDPTYSQVAAQGNYTTTSTTIYPDLWVMTGQEDQDIDNIPDVWESQMAEKFKPVLHKHPQDLQGGLYNFEHLLNGNSTLGCGWLMTFLFWNPETQQNDMLYYTHYREFTGNPLNLIQVGSESGTITSGYLPEDYPYAVSQQYIWNWNSFYKMDQTQNQFFIDVNDNVSRDGHLGSPTGTRPMYYHIYYHGGFYYVQYWYFFTMNDISGQTQNHTWHECDWEHVSIKVKRENGVFEPQEVNFYIHAGGKTYPASQCWWSQSNNCSYSGIQQGYDESHTHLHVWLSENAHASYNRYSLVYEFTLNTILNIADDYYIDDVDYEPTGNDLYFPYDYLEKLGEVDRTTNIVQPLGNSKYWIAFEGRIGVCWHAPADLTSTPGPGPLTMNGENHDYYRFTTSSHGYGYPWGFDPNQGDLFLISSGITLWVPDVNE